MGDRLGLVRLRNGLRRLVTDGATPHGIAGGAAVGLALSLVPIPFAGMFLALLLARPLRLNVPATYAGTAIVNPITGVFFYSAELWLGMTLLGDTPPAYAELRALDAAGWFDLLTRLLVPFGVGALVLATAATAVTYPIVRTIAARIAAAHARAQVEAELAKAPPR